MKRITAFFLVLCMVFSFLPLTALAVESTGNAPTLEQEKTDPSNTDPAQTPSGSEYSLESKQIPTPDEKQTSGEQVTPEEQKMSEEKTVETVKVTFLVDGAVYDTVPVAKDAALGDKMPADPVKKGNTFTGWTFNGASFTKETVVEFDICVAAAWRVNAEPSANDGLSLPPSNEEDGDGENPDDENPDAQNETLVSAWAWVDEMEMLEDGVLALPGANPGMPADFETVVSMLPAFVETEAGERLALSWSCPGYPVGGAYEGSYCFTAVLPKSYALAEGVSPLNVEVELGGASLYSSITVTIKPTIVDAEAVYIIARRISKELIQGITPLQNGQNVEYTHNYNNDYNNSSEQACFIVFVKGVDSLITGLDANGQGNIYDINNPGDPAKYTPDNLLEELKTKGYVACFGWTRPAPNATNHNLEFNITGQKPTPKIEIYTTDENVKPEDVITLNVTITPGTLAVEHQTELTSAKVTVNGRVYELKHLEPDTNGIYTDTIQYKVTEDDYNSKSLSATAACEFKYTYSLKAGNQSTTVETSTSRATSADVTISLAGNGKVSYSFTGEVPTDITLPTDDKTYYEGSEVTVDTTISNGYTVSEGGYIYTFGGWTDNGTLVTDTVKMPAYGGITFVGNWTREPDNTKTKEIYYTVKHMVDGVEKTTDTKTYKGTAWINETNPTIEVQADSLNHNTYTGYKFDKVDPAVTEGTEVADQTVIKLIYVKDQSQTQDTNYTVKYQIAGVEQTQDRIVANGTAWINDDPAQIAIAEVGIPAPEDKYPGYKLDPANPTYPKAGTMVDSGSEYIVNYIPDEASYKVEHYLESLDGEYTRDDDATENMAGTTGETVTAVAKTSYTGFTCDKGVDGTVESGIVTADGKLVLKLYYTRNIYKVTYKYENPAPVGASALPEEQSYKYGASVTVAQAATAPGYQFSGWDKEDFLMPAEDVEIIGSFTAGTSGYQVEHYLENLDGKGFTLKDTENLSGLTDTSVEAKPNSYTGFTFDVSVEGTAIKGTVAADGSLVLKLYYTRKMYTVTYNDGVKFQKVFEDQAFDDLPYGTETPAFKGTPKRSGYTFKGWEPKVSETVTEDVTYRAVWQKNKDSHNGWWDNPKTGDYIMIAVAVLAVSGVALAGLLVYAKKKKK